MKRAFLCTLVLALLVPVAVAKANSYDVYSCWAGFGTFRNPNASSAAWVKDDTAAGGRFTAHDDCGTNKLNGAMTVISLSGYSASNGQSSRLLFTAPVGSTIAHVDLWRNAWSYGTGTGASSQRNSVRVLTGGGAPISGGSDADGTADIAYGTRGTADTTQHGILAANLKSLSPSSLGTNAIEYRVGCDWAAGCPTSSPSGPPPNYFASGVDVYGTRVTVEDTTQPSLSVADSGLFVAAEVSGVRPVLVPAASDTSGIKKLAVFADGDPSPVGALDFEQDLNRCDWSKAAPCQNVSEMEIPVDTRQLADGEHSFVVKAYDAAANEKASTTRYAIVKNGTTPSPTSPDPGPTAAPPTDGTGLPNGIGVAPDSAGTSTNLGLRLTAVFRGTGKTALKAKFGRTVTVRGHLTQGGSPIGDAQIKYSALMTRAGARARNLGSVRTDSNGWFAIKLATKLGSRQLRFAYSPQIGGAIAATAQAQLNVLAPVTFKVGPKRTRNHHAVVFRGRLRAGPIPRKGKLVNLQVVVDGRWHTFATVRSTKRGKFRYRYRFTRTYGRVTYRFRALSRYEAAYPFVAGHSRTVRLRVN
jgi:hypothetical protein